MISLESIRNLIHIKSNSNNKFEPSGNSNKLIHPLDVNSHHSQPI
jgi:hypothetical protein